MNYLLDTNVISEFAADKPHPAVITWLRDHQSDNLFLSVITIGEIQQGIARLPTSQKRAQLTAWLNETLLVAYADMILPIDTTVMLQWGTLTAQLIRQGRKMPVMDALLAATALRHDLMLITRNVSDFSQTGVDLINPWDQ
jgi:predicted nucleic acid-binding protein